MEKIKAGPLNPLPVASIVIVGANVNGKANYMTVGFVSGININPPIICISLNRNHHTPKGILDNETFSINIPTSEYVKQTDYCGLVSGKAIDKSHIFTNFYGELETAPMIKEFPITCECKYINKKIDFKMDTVYFGEIHQVYLNEDIIDNKNKVNIPKADPLIIGMDNKYRTVGKSVEKAYHIGWKYTAEEGITEDSYDKYHCQVITRPTQHTLTIRYQCTPENTQQLIGKAIHDISLYIRSLGVNPSGPPFVTFHSMNGHNMDMEVGFTFNKVIIGKDDIQPGKIPGGKYASCIHVGSYSNLGTTRQILNQWIKENGCESTGVSYEFYLNDPQKIAPDKLKTQLLHKIK